LTPSTSATAQQQQARNHPPSHLRARTAAEAIATTTKMKRTRFCTSPRRKRRPRRSSTCSRSQRSPWNPKRSKP